jgi:hypothetical protein
MLNRPHPFSTTRLLFPVTTDLELRHKLQVGIETTVQFPQQYAHDLAPAEAFPSKSSRHNILRATSMLSIFYSDLTHNPPAQIPANQYFRLKI